MSKLIQSLFVFTLCSLLAVPSIAQDNEAPRVRDKVRVTGGEKTDVVFSRAFMVGTLDSVPYVTPRSGAFTLGISYGFPMGKLMEFKIEPRATWHKIYIRPTEEKNYPTRGTDSALVFEKQRAFYLEMPLGLRFKLARNAVKKYQVLIEAGFSAGINLGGSSKVRREIDRDANGEFDGRMTTKLTQQPDLNFLRYGPYARLGLRYVSIYGFYRMTDIFESDKTYNPTPTTTKAYPSFPKLEVGISITI